MTVVPTPRQNARSRLFCFPCAGGTPQIFHAWPHSLPADVELHSVRLPGRVPRIREQPITAVGLLVDTLACDLKALLDLPYAFFGHSIGALVAFELARHLRRLGDPGPVRLLVSGRRGPRLPHPDPPIHHLPDGTFLARLSGRYNRIPVDVQAEKDLMALLVPALRADYEIVETYQYAEQEPLTCSITAFGGLLDRSHRREHLEPWRHETSGVFDVHMFPGDHFFLESHRTQLLDAIARDLAR